MADPGDARQALRRICEQDVRWLDGLSAELYDAIVAGRAVLGPSDRLTFAEAVHEVRDKLVALRDAPHEKHFGPLCPICGLTTGLLLKLEDWRP